MMSPRSDSSAATDCASVPSPAIGMSTSATVLSGETSTVTGLWKPSLATARSVISRIAAWTSGEVTSSAFTATSAGSWSPGNAACIRS